MAEAGRFAGRVALVTGAGSGIGAAAARLLAGAGAVVHCADRDLAATELTVDSIAATGGEAFALRLDVTDEGQWEATLRRVLERSGRLDLLVNSAGVSFAAPLEETPLADWRVVLSVNLDGVFLGVKHALRAMAAGGGAIVNVSSASGIRPAAGAAAYSASKAAVGMLTRVAAKECRDRRLPVRVNAVSPAGVKTPMWTSQPFFQELVAQHGSEEAAFRALEASPGSGRFAEAEDVARAILFLASDEAALINGVELPVDSAFVL